MTVAFITFGCRLNRAESLDLEARFVAAGHRSVSPRENGEPDMVVVRACSVTAKAQRDCEKELARLRARFPQSDVRLVGCHPRAQPEPNPTTCAPADSGDSSAILPAEPPLAGTSRIPASRAYLKVQDGCSGKCAFCVVPKFRGPPRSVPFRHALERARSFLAGGFRELVLTGCNLALYHSERRGLADLIGALAELPPPQDVPARRPEMPPVHRIRLGSLEPGVCNAAVLDAMENHRNVCRFLHLSLQSGADSTLSRMNRPYTAESVARFCAEARRRLGPRLALGADVITGFPGESESEFEATRRLLEDCRIVNLHAFPYSERPGTPAAKMGNAVPVYLRRSRAALLVREAERRRRQFAASLAGQPVEVCVELGGDHGWTAEYLPCALPAIHPRRALVTVPFAPVPPPDPDARRTN